MDRKETQAFVGVSALAALTVIATAAQEAAQLSQRLQALADTITATIDTLAPATGNTVEDVFDAFTDNRPRGQT